MTVFHFRVGDQVAKVDRIAGRTNLPEGAQEITAAEFDEATAAALQRGRLRARTIAERVEADRKAALTERINGVAKILNLDAKAAAALVDLLVEGAGTPPVAG